MRAIGEMQIGARAVHRDAAKTRALHCERAIAFPCRRIVTRSADDEAHRGRPRPFPFTEKLLKIRSAPNCEARRD